jgi:hypothetical protein
VHEFDLSYGGSERLVTIELFTERGKRFGSRSRPISAYWLPWQSEATAQITLGDRANFFFTSALGGCRMEVAGNTVLHIAGNKINYKSDRDGSRWREAQAQEALGGAYERSRRFSSTKEYRGVDNAFFVGYKRGGVWSFVGQGIGLPTDPGGAYRVAGIWSSLGGGVDRGFGAE